MQSYTKIPKPHKNVEKQKSIRYRRETKITKNNRNGGEGAITLVNPVMNSFIYGKKMVIFGWNVVSAFNIIVCSAVVFCFSIFFVFRHFCTAIFLCFGIFGFSSRYFCLSTFLYFDIFITTF